MNQYHFKSNEFFYKSKVYNITLKKMIKNTTTQFDFEAKPKVTAQKAKYR